MYPSYGALPFLLTCRLACACVSLPCTRRCLADAGLVPAVWCWQISRSGNPLCRFHRVTQLMSTSISLKPVTSARMSHGIRAIQHHIPFCQRPAFICVIHTSRRQINISSPIRNAHACSGYNANNRRRAALSFRLRCPSAHQSFSTGSCISGVPC